MEHKELKPGTGDTATCAARERESDRLGIVSEYLPGGAASDPVLDSLARIASRMFDAPVAFLALVGSERVHFLARIGLASVDAPRQACPCDHVARFGTELVIEDASVDARFADAAIVRVDPKLRFLAAVPLLAPEGAVVGALCVGDTWPRRASAAQMEQLRNLAAVAMQQLLSNRQEAGLRRVESELELHTRHFHNSVDLNCIADREGHLLEINRRWTEVLGWDVESMRGRSYTDFVHEADLARTVVALAGLNEGRNLAGLRIRYRRKDGGYVWLEWTAHAPAPGDSRIFAVARDVGPAVAIEDALRLQNGMLALIGESQGRLFSGTKGREWWTFVLDRLLALTGSEYWFIGFTGGDEQGPFLRTKAITNIAWDDATRELYRSQEAAGLVFRNMNTLF
ncbi:MAG: PAS domain S-box protein, partial [Planctomycetota bacterium]